MAKSKIMAKYNPEKSILENLIAMSEQRELADVAKECDIAFCRYSSKIEGLDVINADDPLRAALDYAMKHKKTCLVHEHCWFGVVHPDARWMQSLKIWESIEEKRRIAESKAR